MSAQQVAIGMRAPDTVSVLGVQVHALESYDHASQYIRGNIRTGIKTFCVAMNPEKVQRATGDCKLRAALEQANLRICDGVGVSLAAWLLCGRMLPRCTGVDLFLHLIQTAAEEGWRVFFLGASPESNTNTIRNLQRSYPALQVAGHHDGFFVDSEEIVRTINDSGADLLFVAMGSPRQEYWINKYLARISVPFCMGVGGSFDVVSGIARRAPNFFRKTGTEWLYRLILNPVRIRRQVALPLFALSVLRQRLFKF